jgi:hypothetical protein
MRICIKGGKNGSWNDEVVYYGLTVTRNDVCLDKGGVYRLQMVTAASDEPYISGGEPLQPEDWSLKKFIDVDRPVTGAVNSSFDYYGNLWVFFGTGRLWSDVDVVPCAKSNTQVCHENHEQYLFGVKEELKNGFLTFKTRLVSELLPVSNGMVYKSGLVSGIPDLPTNPDIPGMIAYGSLTNYLASANTVGYKRKLNLGALLKGQNFNEIALTQPQVTSLGVGKSILALTTYAPGDESCGDYGQGFMYVVDPFTGLAAPFLSQMFKLISQSGGGSGEGAGEASDGELIIPGGVSTGEGIPSGAVLIQAGQSVIARTTTTANAMIDGKVATDQTNTNAIISWREVFNTGSQILKSVMSQGLIDNP